MRGACDRLSGLLPAGILNTVMDEQRPQLQVSGLYPIECDSLAFLGQDGACKARFSQPARY
jgi:hypothetical protein